MALGKARPKADGTNPTATIGPLFEPARAGGFSTHISRTGLPVHQAGTEDEWEVALRFGGAMTLGVECWKLLLSWEVPFVLGHLAPDHQEPSGRTNNMGPSVSIWSSVLTSRIGVLHHLRMGVPNPRISVPFFRIIRALHFGLASGYSMS